MNLSSSLSRCTVRGHLRALLVTLIAACSTMALANVDAGTAAKPNAGAVRPVETISLYTGEVKILRLSEIERVAVGNGELLSVSHQAGELVLIGTSTGYTNLVVWTRDGRIHAFNIDVAGSKSASVEMRRMIYLTVQVVDFRKSVLSRIGINWQQAAAGPVLGIVTNWVNNPYYRIGDPTQGGEDPNRFRGPGGTLTALPLDTKPEAFFGITSSLSSVINLAAQNGDAYILASPQLSTRSGGSADFLAGGEVPIPITSALGQVSVQYKEYGIKLTIKPEADAQGQILASIDTEVSQIDPSVTVNSFPGFLTRRASSSVNVLSNQTIVLSGLMQANGADNVNAVPWLGKIPVLGRLFSSRDYQAARSELVIFVTPTVFDVESPLNNQVIERGLDRIDAFNDGPGRKVYAPGFGSGPAAAMPAPAPEGASDAERQQRQSQRQAQLKALQAGETPPVLPEGGPLVVEPPKPAPASMPVQSTVPPAVQSAPPPVSIIGSATQWGVQVSSSRDLAWSQALARKLIKGGHNAGVLHVPGTQDNPSVYVVRLGPYDSQAAARAAQKQVAAAGLPSAFVLQRAVLFDANLIDRPPQDVSQPVIQSTAPGNGG